MAIEIRPYRDEDEAKWMRTHAIILSISHSWNYSIQERPTYEGSESTRLVAVDGEEIVGLIDTQYNNDPFASMEAQRQAIEQQMQAEREAMQKQFDTMAPARPEMPEAIAKRIEESKARHDEMVKEMESRRAEMEKQMEERRKVAMERKPFEMPVVPARSGI